MRLILALLLLAALALAGCSEGDGGADDGPDPSDDDTDAPDNGGPGAGEDDAGDPDPDGGADDGGNATPLRDPVTWTVSIEDNRFVDGSLTIQVGDTVVWTHDGVVPHTVTSDDGGATFDSGNLVAGSEFSHTFDEVGEFPYRCDYHGSMRETITVLERSDATP